MQVQDFHKSVALLYFMKDLARAHQICGFIPAVLATTGHLSILAAAVHFQGAQNYPEVCATIG